MHARRKLLGHPAAIWYGGRSLVKEELRITNQCQGFYNSEGNAIDGIRSDVVFGVALTVILTDNMRY